MGYAGVCTGDGTLFCGVNAEGAAKPTPLQRRRVRVYVRDEFPNGRDTARCPARKGGVLVAEVFQPRSGDVIVEMAFMPSAAMGARVNITK